MATLATIFPVFFMLGLGVAARVRGWVSPEQKAGASALVFNVLFPLMIFNLMASATVNVEHVFVIGYMVAVYLLALVVGKLLSGFTGKRYAHFSNFLLPVHEGGSVALPLYLSIVGASSNTVIFDMAGMTVTFIFFPVLIQRIVSTGLDARGIVRSIVTNSFVLAVVCGLALNLTGGYALLAASPAGELYASTMDMATSPIVGTILFTIGYDLKIDREMVAPLAKLVVVKVAYYAMALVGMALLFPSLMGNKEFMMAAVIYLMCPTGFMVPAIISPLYRSDEDASFASAFTSLFIAVTLVVYVAVVVFVA